MSSPYDEREFFDQYLQFARQRLGLAGAPEWPTMEALLPAMERVAVLDLGCGLGWFAAWAIEQGAASVDAVDNSERMLSEARVRHGLRRCHCAGAGSDPLR